MANRVTITGDFRDDVEPSSSETGTGWVIGDGYVITAGHVVFEWNRRRGSPLNINDILDGPNTVDANGDLFGFRSSYLSEVSPLPTTGTRIQNAAIEARLVSKDMVVLDRSGSVGLNDAGLVTFLNPEDMKSISSVLGSTGSMYRNGNTTGRVTGSVSVVGNRGGSTFEFVGNADLGDSGAPYILKFDGKEYDFGVHSSQEGTLNAAGNHVIPTGNAVGNYFDYNTWTTLNSIVRGVQTGNVSGSEPINLIVGSANGDTGVVGSFRSDIFLGKAGKDTVRDDPTGAVAWGNDQLFGGEDDDTFILSKGDDLAHGGDPRDYGSGRKPIEDDGIDTVDYSSSAITDTITIKTDVSGNTTFQSVTDAKHRIIVQQSGASGSTDNGTDTLISIENIIGTGGVDKFEVTKLTLDQLAGSDGKGGLAKIDFKENDKPDIQGDLVDASTSNDALEIDLKVDGGYIKDPSNTNGDLKVTILNAERAWGGSKDDKIVGNDKDNELKGGSGDDILEGKGGADYLDGGSGKDSIIIGGGDTIARGEAEDRLYFGNLDISNALVGGVRTVSGRP